MMSRQFSRGLRIGYLGTFHPQNGGAAVSATQLMLELAGAGHRVSVLVPMAQGGNAGDFAAEHPELSIRRFPVPFFHIEPHLPIPEDYAAWERAGIERELPRLLEEEQPEVLLVREIYAWYAMDIAQRYGIPSVILVRGNPTAAIVSGRYPRELTERLLAEYRKADLVIPVADYYLEPLRRLGISNLKSIPNAVDTERFSPRPKDLELLDKLRAADEDIVVVMAGHVKPLKRPLDVVHAAKVCLASDPRLLYVVAGEGPSLDEVKQVARELGVASRFRFVGRVCQEAMPDYLNSADLTIMASELEGLSRVYLETMACAGTLVVSDIAPAREMVEDGVNGLIFSLGDVDDLAEKTLRAAGDPKLRTRLGRAAREHALSYRIEDARGDYEATLAGLLHNSH